MSHRNAYSLARSFGDLKVRPKLMVLHNLFFLVLTCAAYFSLIPQFEQQVADAHAREVAILDRSQASGEAIGPPTTQASPAVDRQLRSDQSYSEAIKRAKIALFLVLGIIYVLAVIVLEAVIVPPLVRSPRAHR